MALFPDGETIHPGETFIYTIPRAVIYDGTTREVLTNLNAPTTFIAQVIPVSGFSGNETPVDMEYNPTRRGTWQAQLTAPDDLGDFYVQAVALKSGGRGEWRDTFTVS
jgi:hypothetical protein